MSHIAETVPPAITTENKMHNVYRILFLEDNPDDVELILHELSEAGMIVEFVRIDRRKEFIATVTEFQPDVILADYSLHSFNGIQAFRMLTSERIDLPFILVTGVLTEEMALQCMKDGIDDFVLKSNFKRLPQAIFSAIDKKANERDKARMAKELQKSHKELGLLLNRHQTSVEEERKTIARDLHDELGQVLTALKIDITMLRKKVAAKDDSRKVDAEFESIILLVDHVMKSVKDISAGLRPDTLDELGLVEAIKAYALEFERRNRIQCKMTLPAVDLEFDKDLSIAVFRIIQEALTNVARHSGATTTEINVRVDEEELQLVIKDNGKGILDSDLISSKSLGIIGIRERVRQMKGLFSIGKFGNGGTIVTVTIPLKNRNREI